MNESSLGREAAEAIRHADFRDVMPLPSLRGLPLAVTAVRALELWSDLATGVKRPAKLKPSERIDVMDECLDVVVPESGRPARFRFAGMTVAELRSALKAAAGYSSEWEQFERVLQGEAVQAMRNAARRRVGQRAPLTCLYQHAFWLPKQAKWATEDNSPPALVTLNEAADPDYVKGRRNRLTVEVVEAKMLATRHFPKRGKRLPLGTSRRCDPWHMVWDDQRLLPQTDESDSGSYHEYQLALPSLETSYFSDHFPARNIFAHLRFSEFLDSHDRRVLLLHEVQSDWMRDLRLQRSGRLINSVRIMSGSKAEIGFPLVPDLPIESSWLDIAMKSLSDVAAGLRVDVIAWVPGHIQKELSFNLPLSVAQRLYDSQVPSQLAKHLTWATFRRVNIDYPTYRRDVFIQHRRGKGWALVLSDHETVVSPFVADRDSIMKLYRIQARPTVERLPAFQVFSNHDQSAQRFPDIDDFDPLPA